MSQCGRALHYNGCLRSGEASRGTLEETAISCALGTSQLASPSSDYFWVRGRSLNNSDITLAASRHTLRVEQG
jgi:hypothetical protein